MATKTSGNVRLVAIAAVAAFIGGCWIGMGSDSSGDPYCVVTMASAASRPGFAPGQMVARSGDECQPGEPTVCGTYEPSTGDDRRFESAPCED